MSVFNQPFPHNSTRRGAFMTAAGFGIFISVFLLVFRPFELDIIEKKLLIKSSILFGFVTFFCIFGTSMFLNFFFPKLYSEEKWTTGKQILNMAGVVVLVGLVNYLVSPLLFDTRLTWEKAFYYQGIAISVGLLPIIIYTLYIQNHKLRQFQQEASTLQEKLKARKGEQVGIPQETVLPVNNIITFEGDNQAEKKMINVNQLIYIEAASNYIKLFFEQQEKITYAIIRMTMKKAEETVTPYPVFFRCHRAYIVNLDKIDKVEGNAQGYKLKMNGAGDLVPVSRNLNSEFSDRLFAFRKPGGLGD